MIRSIVNLKNIFDKPTVYKIEVLRNEKNKKITIQQIIEFLGKDLLQVW